jgi:hypothetical protein
VAEGDDAVGDVVCEEVAEEAFHVLVARDGLDDHVAAELVESVLHVDADVDEAGVEVYVVGGVGGGVTLRVESPPVAVLCVGHDVDDDVVAEETGVVLKIGVETLDGELRLVLSEPWLVTVTRHARPDLLGGTLEGTEVAVEDLACGDARRVGEEHGKSPGPLLSLNVGEADGGAVRCHAVLAGGSELGDDLADRECELDDLVDELHEDVGDADGTEAA